MGGRLAGGAERCEGGVRERIFFTSLREFRAYIEAGLAFRLYVFSHCSFYWRMMNPGEQTNFRPKNDQFFLPSLIRRLWGLLLVALFQSQQAHIHQQAVICLGISCRATPFTPLNIIWNIKPVLFSSPPLPDPSEFLLQGQMVEQTKALCLPAHGLLIKKPTM